MFEKWLRAGLSIVAFFAIAILAWRETETGIATSPRAYAIFAGLAFGANTEDIIKILQLYRGKGNPPL